jgi:hypothetical protein
MQFDVANVEGDGRLVEVDGVVWLRRKIRRRVATCSPSKDRYRPL